jgi:hypothetical protein
VEPTGELDPCAVPRQLVDQWSELDGAAECGDVIVVREHRAKRLRECRLRGLELVLVGVASRVGGVQQQQPARRVELLRGRQLQGGTGPAEQLGVEGAASHVDAVVHAIEPVRRPGQPETEGHEQHDEQAEPDQPRHGHAPPPGSTVS